MNPYAEYGQFYFSTEAAASVKKTTCRGFREDGSCHTP
jgi:hypothetical protein